MLPSCYGLPWREEDRWRNVKACRQRHHMPCIELALAPQHGRYDIVGRWNNNWNFHPVLPVSPTGELNLIARPVIPFYNIMPHATASGQFERTAGLGDMALLELLSPAHSGHWILGTGPTFIFPTATSKFTGQGKVQAGPGVVAGYLTKDFILRSVPAAVVLDRW